MANGHQGEPDELIAANGHVVAIGQVAAKGQVELDELVAANGHDELYWLVVARGQVVAKSQVAADEAKDSTRGLPFSLTKYSAIFAEVEGYFGIENDLECLYSLRM